MSTHRDYPLHYTLPYAQCATNYSRNYGSHLLWVPVVFIVCLPFCVVTGLSPFPMRSLLIALAAADSRHYGFPSGNTFPVVPRFARTARADTFPNLQSLQVLYGEGIGLFNP